ncbi:MAG: redox-sensing transcriptional repressor Rex [Lachnospiraceae bacterium]|nr:redox-sensing transcriptional repressor Rex [Lachnospiraceae bacterium]
MTEKSISRAVIKRLPRYYRYLGELMENGIVRISSMELSERMKVTASQIRQDFNNFGGFGQQGYGYNVEYLYKEIGMILGLESTHNVIIIGAGNVGRALANYSDFNKRGFVFTAIFDNNPKLWEENIGSCKVQPVDMLEEYVREHKVEIAALTLPKESAPQVAAKLVNLGVKAIWNFAPTDLNLPEDVLVENVHLAESLMRLSFRIKESGI